MALRRSILVFAVTAALALSAAGDAFARAGSGSSFGSRGARTFSAPPATSLAPRGAAPMQRSLTAPSENFFRSSPLNSQSGFFPGSFGRGLLGGFLGAGLFGLLFGHGLFGGLGGGLSILGLLLQIGLLVLLFKLVMGFVRGGRPAFQGANFGASPREPYPQQDQALRGAFAGPRFGAAGPLAGRKLDLTQEDYSTFEQRLAAIQSAYSAGDETLLRSLTTPEMASYFANELAANARKGVVNRLSNVTFLQGNLAEAWSEPQADYATVAMRFSLIDTMVDRASGRVVSGDPAAPQEVTEVWTFTRLTGSGPDGWRLSAIQQA
ncbi:MAG TPA: Tim44 domain-containing protein [Methylocella sp.]|nr:Tim44 domain-containing protein [Methylocella sp.]